MSKCNNGTLRGKGIDADDEDILKEIADRICDLCDVGDDDSETFCSVYDYLQYEAIPKLKST